MMIAPDYCKDFGSPCYYYYYSFHYFSLSQKWQFSLYLFQHLFTASFTFFLFYSKHLYIPSKKMESGIITAKSFEARINNNDNNNHYNTTILSIKISIFLFIYWYKINADWWLNSNFSNTTQIKHIFESCWTYCTCNSQFKRQTKQLYCITNYVHEKQL